MMSSLSPSFEYQHASTNVFSALDEQDDDNEDREPDLYQNLKPNTSYKKDTADLNSLQEHKTIGD